MSTDQSPASLHSLVSAKTGDQQLKLKRRFGLLHGIAIVCGTVIGTGIWISPGVIMERTNSTGAALIIWLITGAITMLIGLTYIELGTTFPNSGGMYLYIKEAFGDFPAFMYQWSFLLLLRPGSNAIKLQTFANYTLRIVFPHCSIPQEAVLLLTTLLSLLVVYVNCVNVKLSARGQSFSVGVCVFALLGISIIGLIWIGRGHGNLFTNMFEGATDKPVDYILAFYACYYTYSGVNLPRVVTISCLLSTTLYLLANISYCGVLKKEEMIHSAAVAADFATRTLGVMAWIVPVCVALNTGGSFNAGVIVGSRTCFVSARNGQMPGFFNQVSLKHRSPITAIIFQGLLSALYCYFDIRAILYNHTLVGVLFHALCIAGLLWLRYSRPSIPRPFKMPIGMYLFIIVVFMFLVFVPLITKPKASGIGILLLLSTGIPYYWVTQIWRPANSIRSVFYRKLFCGIQKVLVCAKEEQDLT